jgi:hypothetical protein
MQDRTTTRMSAEFRPGASASAMPGRAEDRSSWRRSRLFWGLRRPDDRSVGRFSDGLSSGRVRPWSCGTLEARHRCHDFLGIALLDRSGLKSLEDQQFSGFVIGVEQQVDQVRVRDLRDATVEHVHPPGHLAALNALEVRPLEVSAASNVMVFPDGPFASIY